MSRGIKGIKEIVKYSRSKESVDEEDYGYPKEESYNFISKKKKKPVGLEMMSKEDLIAMINELKYELEASKSANLAIQRNYEHLSKMMVNEKKNNFQIKNNSNEDAERISELEGLLTNAESELSILRQKYEREKAANTDLDAKLKVAVEERQKYKLESLNNSSELRALLASKEGDINRLKIMIETLNEQIERKTLAEESISKINKGLEEKIKKLEYQGKVYEERLSHEAKSSEMLEHEIKSLQQDYSKLEDEGKALKGKIESLTKANLDISGSFDNERATYSKSINELTAEISKLRDQIKQLKSDNYTLQHTITNDADQQSIELLNLRNILKEQTLSLDEYKKYSELIEEYKNIMSLNQGGYVLLSKKENNRNKERLETSQAMLKRYTEAVKKKDQKLIEKQEQIDQSQSLINAAKDEALEAYQEKKAYEIEVYKLSQLIQEEKLKSENLAKEIDILTKSLRQQESDNVRVSKALILAQDDIQLKITEIKKLNQEIKAMENARSVAKSSEISALQDQLLEAIDKAKLLEGQTKTLGHFKDLSNQLTLDIELMKKQFAEAQSDLKHSSETLHKQTLEMKNMGSIIVERELEITRLKKIATDASSDAERHRMNLVEKREEIRSLEIKLEHSSHLKSEIQDLKLNIANTAKQYSAFINSMDAIKTALSAVKISLTCSGCLEVVSKKGYTTSPCLHYYCEDCKDSSKSVCKECTKYVDFVFENTHLSDLGSKYTALSEAVNGVQLTN